VAGVAEVEGELREIAGAVAEAVERETQSQRVAVARQRLAGVAAERAAERERGEVDELRQHAQRRVARDVARDERLHVFESGLRRPSRRFQHTSEDTENRLLDVQRIEDFVAIQRIENFPLREKGARVD
jgi:hypothetical protein